MQGEQYWTAKQTSKFICRFETLQYIFLNPRYLKSNDIIYWLYYRNEKKTIMILQGVSHYTKLAPWNKLSDGLVCVL